MKVKKYKALSMYEAVQKIKEEFGSEAIILQAEEVPLRRFGFIPAGKVWEVLAAVDDGTEMPFALQSNGISKEIIPNNNLENSNNYFNHSLELREIALALADLQLEVRRLSKQEQFTRIAAFSPTLRSLYQQLREQEIDEEIIFEIVTNIGEELSPQALNNYGTVADCASKYLQSLAKCTGPLRIKNPLPLPVFLFGPTGVGKTTTIAKLAANFALMQKKKVLLVTIDTYKVAALPQLNAYADIMGLSMEVAYTPAELKNIIDKNKDKDIIIIDTPGSGQRNENQIEELKAFSDAIENKLVYLTISASTRYKELIDVVERFGVLSVDSLLVTKTDEALVFGPILNLVYKFKKPLSYLTTGQKVPDDIEAASPAMIADILLGRVFSDGS